MPTPDGPPDVATWQRIAAYRPGESPLQCATRDDFERLANQLAGLPESVERERSLLHLTKSCELAVAAAGKVS